MIKEIKKHIQNNYLAFTLYIFITAYFLLQHYSFLAWDFSAYVLNARYLFYGGSYFELYRAPLVPLLLAIFMIFGKFGEYIFVFFTSTLFYYSIFKLSETIQKRFFQKKIEKEVVFFLFYFLINGYFVFRYGVVAGTELISLAFFSLFLAFYFNNKISGHFLALSFLSRYNLMFFVPLLFIRKDIKLIIKDILIFLVICLPWFLWNFINYGNWLASIIDSYWLNVYSRQHLIEPFNWINLILAFNWRWFLFIIGIVLGVYLILKNKKPNQIKIIFSFILIFLIILYDNYSTPFKVERYLFNLILPLAFFSLLGICFLILKVKINKKIIILLCFLIFAIIFSNSLKIISGDLSYRNDYYNTAKIIENEDLLNCAIYSPIWVPVTYYTENVYYLDRSIKEAVEQNRIVLIFKGKETYDDNFIKEDLEENKKLYEDEKIILFGDKTNCFPKYEKMEERHTFEYCKALATKFGNGKLSNLAEKSCRLINIK